MHIVIIGAGVAGIATAWQLTRLYPACRVTLLDREPPGSVASNKGTEAFRTFWPDDATGGLFPRHLESSVDALSAFAARHPSLEFQTRGYAFFSEQPHGSEQMRQLAREQAARSGLPLNEDPAGLAARREGASFIRDAAALRLRYPGLSPAIRSALVFHRCGWFRSQEYLKSMLFEAMSGRFTFTRASLEALSWGAGKVRLQLDDGGVIEADKAIVCAGQHSQAILRRIDLRLPLCYEAHSKAVLPDPARLLAGLPFSFYADAFELDFSEQERAADLALAGLQGQRLPGHFHVRENWPDAQGEPSALALWTYDCSPVAEPEARAPQGYLPVLLQGLRRLLPDYALPPQAAMRVALHTGIYTKMPDNMPCIGTLVPGRVYINSALSGFGYMFSQQASELIARHCMEDGEVPAIFHPLRRVDSAANASTHHRGQM